MSQPQNGNTNLLDPFGIMPIMKQARDANLDALSKFMIELVNSDEYAQATGVAMAQSLAASQPVRQAMERSMTSTLQALNMPSRAEVSSIAERIVNIEMRLDDLDAKLNANQKVLLIELPVVVTAAVAEAVQVAIQETLQQSLKEAEQAVLQEAVKEGVRQALATPARHIREIETRIGALDDKVNTLQLTLTPDAVVTPPADAKKAQES